MADPSEVLAGVVLKRAGDPDECPIRMWSEGGWYWWECRGGRHEGGGQHRTRDGREAAVREHDRLFRAARARGLTDRWSPADVARPALPHDGGCRIGPCERPAGHRNGHGRLRPEDGPCCDMHNRRCEPPGDLCCRRCTEATHDAFPIRHPDGSRCVHLGP